MEINIDIFYEPIPDLLRYTTIDVKEKVREPILAGNTSALM
jgi:hypothetical protein